MSPKPLASLVDNEAELAVLGGVLIRPDLLPLLPDIDLDCFVNPHHGHIWAAMRNLEAAGSAIDVVTVADQLERDGHLETPLTLLGECALRVPTPENVEAYAAILRRHRIGRDVDNALAVIKSKLAAGQLDGPDALVEAQCALSRIEQGADDQRGQSLGTIVRGICDEIHRGQVAPACMRTGLDALDRKTGGVPFGVVTFVLAPPGNGKSTFALVLAESAEKQGDTPLLYTYEDGHRSFGLRTIARHSGVPTEVIRTADFERGQMTSIGYHMAEILRRRTIVIRAGGMTVDELIRDVRARRLKHSGDGSTGRLVLLDYVQLVPLPTLLGGTVNDRMGQVCKRLSEFAASEDIAIVVFSQVGRQVPKEARPPSMVDARDCGVIEMVGKLMLGMYRPALYGQPPSESDSKKAAPNTLVEFHIIKNNQGETGVHVEAYWDLATHTIVDKRDDLAGRFKG